MKCFMKRRLVSMLAAASFSVLAACTTLAAETRISTQLSASDYNDIANRYLERPTFVSLQTLSDGAVTLRVRMDRYDGGYDAQLDVVLEHSLPFDQRFVGEYLPLIDKYLEWEKLAIERGDQIEREIGRATTWANSNTAQLKFSLFSSNAMNHVLLIDHCVAIGCAESPMVFSKPNAIELRRLLVDLRDGRITHAPVDQIYN